MNFYTSSSSKAKIISSIVLFVVLMAGLDLALNLYAARKTTQQSWIENKLSKSRHFQLLNQHNLDYVFIGSSRTIFHIDSNTLKQSGFDVYNFGVSGMVLTDYPYFVHEAIKTKPKAIVLNISVQQLYQPSMQDDFKEITATDLHYIYKTQPWDIKRDATFAYVKHWHSLLVYADSIYLRIKQALKRFALVTPPPPRPDRADKIQPPQRPDVGCKVFDANKVSEQKTVLKCTNGDGVLLGNSIEDDRQIEVKNLMHFNPDYVRLLNALVQTIRAANITPIIILEPILNHQYSYDLRATKQNLSKAIVYDLTHAYGSTDYWADASHFNSKGRLYYSNRLSKIFLVNTE